MIAIYLTREQILNMAKGGCEGNGPEDCHDVVIELANAKNDMVIHSADNLMSTDNWQGSGVFFDADGNEHFGPGAPYAKSDRQDEFHKDPHIWLDFEARYRATQPPDFDLERDALGDSRR
jgi:hypothetical protein